MRVAFRSHPFSNINRLTVSTLRRAILKPSKRFLALIALVVVIFGFITAAYALHLFGLGLNCGTRPVGPPGSAVFTIVMANAGPNFGFNGSRYQGGLWPVMNVTVNQTVIIHVINNGSEPHGFQIVHYFEGGINGVSGLSPGACYDVRFTANVLGSFTVRCDIFCSIHAFMLRGVLNVNP